MGVWHYNCEVCDTICSDEERSYECEGCGKEWCARCHEYEGYRSFHYDGKIYCDFCFGAVNHPVADAEVLKFCLDRLGSTREAIEAEMPKRPKRIYECVIKEEHGCHKDCPYAKEDYDDYDDTRTMRGACCAAQGRTCEAKRSKKKQRN